jgi:3'(2'), 5'-bisphosphate nucleotidase
LSLLAEIEQIVQTAGKAIMAIYGREFSVEEKEDRSPLTEADIAANKIITKALCSVTPLVPVLSEEAVEAFQGPNKAGQYWLVDPLDGTKEFIKKNGEFTVNIALIENGEPILGVVHAPALGFMYSAEFGKGAFKTDSLGNRTRIHVTSHTTGTRWKVVGSRSHAGDSLNAWLQQLGDHELIPMGSSLKFCLVAEGRADIYPRLGPTSMWDTAAGHCVVEQAGGEVVKLDGTRLDYLETKDFLNPHFIARTSIKNN